MRRTSSLARCRADTKVLLAIPALALALAGCGGDSYYEKGKKACTHYLEGGGLESGEDAPSFGGVYSKEDERNAKEWNRGCDDATYGDSSKDSDSEKGEGDIPEYTASEVEDLVLEKIEGEGFDITGVPAVCVERNSDLFECDVSAPGGFFYCDFTPSDYYIDCGTVRDENGIR